MERDQKESPENQGQEQKAQRYVNLLLDPGFKAVFGDIKNKEIVISFINAVLDGERVVRDLEYTNNEVSGKTVTSKGVRYDLHCTDAEGVRFTIEMQKADNSEDFYQRSVYYGARLYDIQQGKGSKDYFSQPVYVIGIMESHLKCHPSGYKNVISRYRMTEKESREVGIPTISCIFVELGYFKKKQSECRSIIDKWCWCLKYIYHEMEQPAELTGEIFVKLFAACEIAQFTPEKHFQYESDMMTLRDYEHDLFFSEKTGYKKGRAEGIAEGKAEGIAEGRAIGVKETAVALKREGIPLSVIARATGLSEEVVSAL